MDPDSWQAEEIIGERNAHGRYDALMHQAAAQLVGRHTGVFVRPTMVKRAGGTASLLQGVPTVEINPSSTIRYTLQVFAHECAHLRLGHNKGSMAPVAAQSIPLADPQSKPEYKKIEAQADGLADRWVAYAEQNQANYSGDWLSRRLKALYHMK